MGNWLNNKLPRTKQRTDIPREKRLSWFLVLLLVGLGICMPKLLRPIGVHKQGYWKAVNWLRENTVSTDIIAVSDSRIAFYAGRKGSVYTSEIPERTSYAVKLYKDDLVAEKDIFGAKKLFSFTYNNKGAPAMIYDVRGYISEKVRFVEYHCENISDGKYKFYFVFELNGEFEKDWIIYFHGYVKDEHVILLPEHRQKSKFANWDFSPRPATSTWPKNERITITREILAERIPYRIKFAFYRRNEGTHGRPLNLGWVDIGNAKQNNSR